MARFYLIRHGSIPELGKRLWGRTAGVDLTDAGREEVAMLAQQLTAHGIERVLTSPLERTRQTAEIIANRTGCPFEIDEALNEIDFGEWAGLHFDELGSQELWERFNTHRSQTRPPGGETMQEAQKRIVTRIGELRAQHPHGRFALVSHGDVIRAALMYYLRMSVDDFRRLEVGPATASVVEIDDSSERVLSVNAFAATES